MGCGSSSLKGEKVDNVHAEPVTEPIKRVKTNFSEVDFSGDAGGARRGKSFAVAPDEQRRPTAISEHYNEDPISPVHNETIGSAEGEKLAPYRTIDGDNDLASPTTMTNIPHDKLSPTNQVTSTTRDTYATTNQPLHEQAANHTSMLSETSALPQATTGERTKSWYARIQNRSKGRNNSQISDEELQRLFGMTRPEWNAYVADPRNGVGGHAKPNSMPYVGLSGGFT